MSNRLAGESSPYLRQHANNPVDWYPWGPEALGRASGENRPIFLSAGYSSCHWCHVMAHESFEDLRTAELLNAEFVSIKLDRQERPDLDAFAMRAVQLMTGRGGWPLSLFLTPDLHPIFGGTYFPPEPRFGMPSFRQVLEGVSRAWRENPARVARSAREIRAALLTSFEPAPPSEVDPAAVVEATLRALLGRFDRERGGFGSGPKFPQPPLLEFLLMEGVRRDDRRLLDGVFRTLGAMARGGVRDQVGGGFHRYSVDGDWRVPHYEKMLYDNAQLASLYALAHRATGRPDFLRVAREVLDDMGRVLALPGGGFAAALDADSEGEEGRYYRWTPDQVRRVLGEEAGAFFRDFPLGEGRDELEATTLRRSDGGEGTSGGDEHLQRTDAWLLRIREAREKRVPPGLDTQRLTDWNALAAKAHLDVYRAGGGGAYRSRGLETLEGLWNLAWSGGVLHHIAGTPARVPGFLADYAYLAQAEWTAYEVTAAPAHLARCDTLLRASLERFRDPAGGRFFETPAGGSEGLPTPLTGEGDGVLPSPSAVLALTLWNWERLEGGGWARGALDELLEEGASEASHEPGSRPLMAGLALWRSLPGIEVVVAAPAADRAFEAMWRAASGPVAPGLLALPFLPVPGHSHGTGPAGLFAGRTAPAEVEARLCTDATCSPPITEPAILSARIAEILCRPRPPGPRPP